MASNTSNTPEQPQSNEEDQPASDVNSRRRTDIAWRHCTKLPSSKGKGMILRCNHCGHVMAGGGINRMKQHLAGVTGQVAKCQSVNPDVRFEILGMLREIDNAKKNKRPSLSLFDENEEEGEEETENATEIDGTAKKQKTSGIASFVKGRGKIDTSQPGIKFKLQSKEMIKNVDIAVAKWWYDACIPLNVVNSPHFVEAMNRISAIGPGYSGPSYHALRVSLLQEVKAEVTLSIDALRSQWVDSGCTIMADGWTDRRRRSLINFLVYCPKGISFIKSVDASDIVSTSENLCDLFSDIVKMVGVENVVHMVTDNAANYKKAGKLLSEKYPSIFWSPCSAHCINLILKDVSDLPKVKSLAHNATRITSFVYNRKWTNSWLKQQPGWTEIIVPGATRFGTTFLSLQSICERQDFLARMVVDPGFKKFMKEDKGVEVRRIILDNDFWKDCEKIVKVMIPIIKLLRICDSDEKPSTGFVYEGMSRAINGVKTVLEGKEHEYKVYVDIINARWDKMLRKNLHATAYWLNPLFQYGDNSPANNSAVLSCVYDVVEKLCPTSENLVREMTMFRDREGTFGCDIAKKNLKDTRPDVWWSLFGGDAPNLQTIVVKLLSQTSSSSGCERNWSVFERIHTKKRNRLEHTRLNDLVFVHYNLRLEKRNVKKKYYDPIDYESIDKVEPWVIEEDASGEQKLDYNELEEMLGEGQENDEGASSSQPSIGNGDANRDMGTSIHDDDA